MQQYKSISFQQIARQERRDNEIENRNRLSRDSERNSTDEKKKSTSRLFSTLACFRQSFRITIEKNFKQRLANSTRNNIKTTSEFNWFEKIQVSMI